MSLHHLGVMRQLREAREAEARRQWMEARDAADRALQAVHFAEAQIARHEAQIKARIEGFYQEVGLRGVSAAELISTRAFHTDLRAMRAQFEKLAQEARDFAQQAAQEAEARRQDWARAHAAVEKIAEMQDKLIKEARRSGERLEEREAEEIALSRVGRAP